MDDKTNLLLQSFGAQRFKHNEPLKYQCEIKGAGVARLFTIVFTTNELVKMVAACRELGILFFLMGLGSKLLIAESGFEGLVIKNRTKNIQTISVKGKVTRNGIGVDEAYIEVDSGVSIQKFAEYLTQQKLASDEFVGIPGTVGGNIFINRILQNRVKSIKVLTLDGVIEITKPDSLSLNEHLVLSVIFVIKSKSL